MKLSTAFILLTIGATEARAGTRRARRRAQDAAADAATVSDSDFDAVDAADKSPKAPDCFEEEVSGLVHISFTGGNMDNTYPPCLTPPCGVTEVGTAAPAAPPVIMYPGYAGYGYGSGGVTSYGGIAFEYNSNLESVTFKSPAGSNFDFNACAEYEKKDSDFGCGGIGRRMLNEEEGDVEEDRRNDCRGKNTILYCPMKEGQSATFELTDTMRYCEWTPTRRNLQDDEGEEVAEDMRKKALAGIKFYVTTPGGGGNGIIVAKGNDIKGAVPEGGFVERPIVIKPIGGCFGEDIVAAFQCGPTRDRGFDQTSQCLYGDDSSPLGSEYALDLEDCLIRSPKRSVIKMLAPAKLEENGDGRRLTRNIVSSIGGDPKGAFYEKDNIIAKDAVDLLLKMSEQKYSLDDFDPKAPHHQQDFRAGSNLTPERLAFYELSGEQLVEVIGKDNSKAILDFVHGSFGNTATVSKISLQHANLEEQMYFTPHMDEKDTALIFLGGSNANVVYLNNDGQSEATTYPGKALAHGANTVHKSTNFEGHRHTLEVQTMQGGDCILTNLVN